MEAVDVEASQEAPNAPLVTHDARSDDVTRDSRHKALMALLALVPIVNLTSDLCTFNSLMIGSNPVGAAIVLVVLFFNWRFVALYAALIPEPSFTSVSALFLPFLLHPLFGHIMGITEGAGPKELSKIYAEADATRARADGAALMLPHRLAPTPSLPQEQMQQVEALTRSPYGPELGWYREWLLAEHRTYRQLGLLSKVGFILMSELKLFFMGFFLGIKLLWNTAIQLALETLDSDIKYKGSKEVHTGAVADKFTGRLHVLTVLEANNAGLLQLLLQTLIFVTHPGSINPYVFAFSLSCSALVVWNALQGSS